MIASNISLRWEVKTSEERMGGVRDFRRAEFATLVGEDGNECLLGKQHRNSVTV